jgi:acyl-CoA thioesterase II
VFPLAEDILALLDLEQIGTDRFRGVSPSKTSRTVYGGQAVAQALVAVLRTVPSDRRVHSLHAYFVLAGDPNTPIDFIVERIRDGRSFTTRRCVASQRGASILSLEASFHIEETGLEHAVAMPEAPPPETLPTTSAIGERFKSFLPQATRSRLAEPSSIDMRVVAPEHWIAPFPRSSGRQLIWFKVLEPLPNEQAIHSALLAYFSDMTLLNTALVPHGRVIFDPTLQVASLDHAVWFHRPFHVDDWLLFVQDSPSAFGCRALTRGELFTRDGTLVASVAQEGLIRPRSREH